MKERNRIFLLVLIMSVVALGATGVAMGALYRVAIRENSERLRETVQSRARLIEAVSRHDVRVMGPGKKREAFEATFFQVREAHERFRGFGETGEFTLAKRSGDQIDFLLSHRHRDVDHPDSVPFSSDLAEPMRKALSGESGTMVGPDYRGETVLAAHEPVSENGLGIVAKIDMAEVRRPFLKAGALAGAFAVAFVLGGTILFLRIGNPIIEALEEKTKRLQAKIEEQENTERALSRSRARFKNIYSSNMIGILFWDAEGNITDANDAFLDMVGYTRAELENGKLNWRMMTPREHAATDEEAMGMLAAAGVTKPFEKEYLHRDGHRVPVILGAALEPGAARSGVAFVLDRTERKAAEEATLQSLREKEVLVREIHHRVKNNLQVISSMLNLQRRASSDTSLVDSLAESRDRIRTMALVHETLYKSDNARIVRLGDYVRSIASNLFRSYGVSPDKIDLRVDVADVQLDVSKANACGMIVNELLSNALKHGFPNGRKGRVTVSMRKNGKKIDLRVEDDGVGIAAGIDVIAVDSLGMKLVTAFVDQLNGTFEIQSEAGTMFAVSFEAEEGQAHA